MGNKQLRNIYSDKNPEQMVSEFFKINNHVNVQSFTDVQDPTADSIVENNEIQDSPNPVVNLPSSRNVQTVSERRSLEETLDSSLQLAASICRETLKLIINEGSLDAWLFFEFNSSTSLTINIYFLSIITYTIPISITSTRDDLLPISTPHSPCLKGIYCTMLHPSIGEHPHVLSFNEYFPSVVPLVIELIPNQENQKHYTYCAWDPKYKNIKCYQQILQYKNYISSLFALYGCQAQTNQDNHHGLSNEKSSSCVICLSNKPTIIMMPCGHMCICEQCFSVFHSRENRCPICRQAVIEASKL